jgi:hypothetical protein
MLLLAQQPTSLRRSDIIHGSFTDGWTDSLSLTKNMYVKERLSPLKAPPLKRGGFEGSFCVEKYSWETYVFNSNVACSTGMTRQEPKLLY